MSTNKRSLGVCVLQDLVRGALLFSLVTMSFGPMLAGAQSPYEDGIDTNKPAITCRTLPWSTAVGAVGFEGYVTNTSTAHELALLCPVDGQEHKSGDHVVDVSVGVYDRTKGPWLATYFQRKPGNSTYQYWSMSSTSGSAIAKTLTARNVLLNGDPGYSHSIFVFVPARVGYNSNSVTHTAVESH